MEEPTVADLMAFQDLPGEVQALARRAVLAEVTDDVDLEREREHEAQQADSYDRGVSDGFEFARARALLVVSQLMGRHSITTQRKMERALREMKVTDVS